LLRYHQVVLQRNHLLRRWREGGPPPGAREEAAFWNREMVEHGSYLIAARARFVSDLAPLLEHLHLQLSGTAERLRMVYRPQVPCPPEADEPGIAFAYRQALASVWPREVELGQSLLGPHRDDLAFSLDKNDLATYGSRGQQRTATIALKLAQVEWLRRQSGEAPLVLLDDVLSELDPARRGYLQGWLLEGGYQVVLTATDLGSFSPITLEQSTVYRVESGRWTLLERSAVAELVGKPG
ncbi:MAG: DNA replication/repair protein RecF, partial [Chloroflexia bacterium]